MTFQALPGFRDFPPETLALRRHIFTLWRQVAERYGFQEYDGPPLEPLELYTAKSGDEIVSQLYHFEDKGGRAVALRPEMTPTLARMVADRAGALRKPIRWYAMPQLFRYERQQRGRLREHYQLNCDLIGEPGPLADAEVIALAIDIMRGFGLTAADVRVRVSDRQVLRALLLGRGIRDESLPGILQAVDRIEKDPVGAQQLLAQQLATYPQADDLARDVVAITELRSREAVLARLNEADPALADRFREMLDGLDAMGLGDWIDVDMTIVRGLAYYTGTVFELFDAGRTLRAICGGGRYDTLAASLGGVDLPAVGFGMGDVVLSELLKDRGLLPDIPTAIDIVVAAVTPDDRPHVLTIAHTLRDAGFRTDYALTELGLGKQLRGADARGARLVVVVGPDDRARGEVQVKDLRRQQQEAVPVARVTEHCRTLLERTHETHG